VIEFLSIFLREEPLVRTTRAMAERNEPFDSPTDSWVPWALQARGRRKVRAKTDATPCDLKTYPQICSEAAARRRS
jgi:hypothetical protein